VLEISYNRHNNQADLD